MAVLGLVVGIVRFFALPVIPLLAIGLGLGQDAVIGYSVGISVALLAVRMDRAADAASRASTGKPGA
jgi:hypothetical protein